MYGLKDLQVVFLMSQMWLTLFQSDPFQDLQPEMLEKQMHNIFSSRNMPKIKWKVEDRLHTPCEEQNGNTSSDNKGNVVLCSFSATYAHAA